MEAVFSNLMHSFVVTVFDLLLKMSALQKVSWIDFASSCDLSDTFPDSLKAFGRPIGVLDPASAHVKDSVCAVGLNALAL